LRGVRIKWSTGEMKQWSTEVLGIRDEFAHGKCLKFWKKGSRVQGFKVSRLKTKRKSG
jgi:hypothetical protein